MDDNKETKLQILKKAKELLWDGKDCTLDNPNTGIYICIAINTSARYLIALGGEFGNLWNVADSLRDEVMDKIKGFSTVREMLEHNSGRRTSYEQAQQYRHTMLDEMINNLEGEPQ